MRVVIVGVGSFAQSFIPLFKAHPLVEEVALADLDADKLEACSTRYQLTNTFTSLDSALESDVDAVAIFTQNWLHGPQAVSALRAGKHVYSAVPPAISVEEVQQLVGAVEASGLIYMLGETSYYYPATLYCRRKLEEGAFGRVVYSEGEYYHDWDHGLYDVMRWRGGEQWLRFAGSPPMYYPTHSVSPIVSVLGARMTHVSCQGFVDEHEDRIYAPGSNLWDNRYSNQSALYRMSDGSICRINEFRRVGHPCAERISIFGTEGCFQDSAAGKSWIDKHGVTPVADLLECRRPWPDGSEVLEGRLWHGGISELHEVDRLPREFASLSNGHFGSHQFLVDDFVKAVHSKRHPPNNVWQAARYVLPGLIAHQSALAGGQLMEIPDYGDGPRA